MSNITFTMIKPDAVKDGHIGAILEKINGDLCYKTLSNNRAKAIYDYVIEKGPIPAANLSYKGYGDTKPKAPNDSPENKAKNRRTELKVLAK